MNIRTLIIRAYIHLLSNPRQMESRDIVLISKDENRGVLRAEIKMKQNES